MRSDVVWINIVRLVVLLIAAFLLGWISYSQFADIGSPSTLYLIPSDDAGKWLGGEWTVADLAGATHSTQIGKATALALIGTMVKVKKHEFAFDDLSCSTEFPVSIEQPVAFFEDYGTTPFLMHMHMPNTRIDAGCADLYPLAHDMIFISYDGYFLEAVRRSPPPDRVEFGKR